jgi:putative hydrolase of HD superfamily
MKKQISSEVVDKTIELGGLMLEFATVYRATYLNKNHDKESDTDHTVMLAIIACAVAAEFHPEYDLGKVSQYALIHDLVEVYAGDVNTINFHTIDVQAKEKAEAKAFEKIKHKFGKTFPWIHETIEAYESLLDPEARFIKTLDKCLPAITHYFTDNKAVNEGFDDPVAFEHSVNSRSKAMRQGFAHDQPVAMGLREAIVGMAVDRKYKYHVKKRAV